MVSSASSDVSTSNASSTRPEAAIARAAERTGRNAGAQLAAAVIGQGAADGEDGFWPSPVGSAGAPCSCSADDCAAIVSMPSHHCAPAASAADAASVAIARSVARMRGRRFMREISDRRGERSVRRAPRLPSGVPLRDRPVRAALPPLADLVTDSAIEVCGRTFHLRPGEWTVDTSMALCLAQSLVTTGGSNRMARPPTSPPALRHRRAGLGHLTPASRGPASTCRDGGYGNAGLETGDQIEQPVRLPRLVPPLFRQRQEHARTFQQADGLVDLGP